MASLRKLTSTQPTFTAVISTCSRGIGREFANQLLHRTDENFKIIGLCRSVGSDLLILKEKFPSKFFIVDGLDLENQSSIENTVKNIRDLTNNKLDLLLNVAGILGNASSDPGPEKTFTKIDRKWLQKSLDVSTTFS